MLPLDDTNGAEMKNQLVHGDGNEREVCVVVAPGDAATARTGAAVLNGEDTDNDTKPLPDIAT